MTDLKDDDEDLSEEMALERLAPGGADRAVASAFLRAKTAVLKAQIHQLRVGHFREWLYASAEVVLGLVILLLFVGLASAVWSAAHDNGLVIESFSVPPDFQSRGLSGQVVASQLLDRLSAMQAQTVSNRASSSYTNNWGNDIKVQIPNTGVSIGDLNRYLRDWLGNETHISGEVYRDGGDVTITARVEGAAASSFTGPLSDYSKLMQQAAEAVYRNTQPYRYAVYLDGRNRTREATPVYEQLVQNGSMEDRAWAYIGLSSEASAEGNLARADQILWQSVAVNPNLLLPYNNLSNNEGTLQHDEAAFQATKKAVEIARRGPDTSMNKSDFEVAELENEIGLAGLQGDLASVMAYDKKLLALPNDNNSWNNAHQSDMLNCSDLHDVACLRAAVAAYPHASAGNNFLNFQAGYQLALFNLQRWKEAIALAPDLATAAKKMGPAAETFVQLAEHPLLGRAYAGLGDFVAAHRYLDPTPPDCVECLRYRGEVATLEKRWGAANYWFARAVALSPSLPASYLDWGQSLVHQGAFDTAIEKFKIATDRSIHYADPLEGWGEALIGKNRSDLALAKFEEADKYAPRWGRLHLKWGDALLYSGDKDGAQKQFAIAAGLNLSEGEKSELKRMAGAHD